MEEGKDLSPVEEQEDSEEQPTSEVYELFRTPHKFQPKGKYRKSSVQKRKFSQESPENKEDKRPRTPSGQYLTNSVADIKSKLEDKLVQRGQVHDYSEISVQSTINCETAQALEHGNTLVKYHDQGVGKVIKGTQLNRCESEITYQEFVKSLKLSDQTYSKMSGKSTSAIDRVIDTATTDINKEVRSSQQTNQENPYENPEVMDVRAVITLLEKLKIEVKNGVKEEIQKDLVINQMQLKITQCEYKERTMIEIMSRMQDTIDELQAKNEMFERNNAKKMLILSGMYTAKKRKHARMQITSFLKDEMRCDVALEDFYYVGSAVPRDIVLIFATLSDKHLVLQGKSLIKDLINKDGKGYYFRDFKTQMQNEVSK